MKTDTELKQALVKMLPDKVTFVNWSINKHPCMLLTWMHDEIEVLDTELLHLCWLVEETLTIEQQITYLNNLYLEPSVENNPKWKIHPDCHATWQQRITELMKVKYL